MREAEGEAKRGSRGTGAALIQNKSEIILIIKPQSVQRMALTSARRTGFAICLILTILLVGLHFAVAGTGHEFFKADKNPSFRYINDTNYSDRDYHQFAAFVIIAAGLTFFISIILLVALCADKLTPKTRHVLATFNLILEFAIAVVVAIAASQASNLRDYLHNQPVYQGNDDLDLYYRLAIADTVITFVLQLIYLVVIYFGTLDEIEHSVVLTPVIANPPLTADRFN